MLACVGGRNFSDSIVDRLARALIFRARFDDPLGNWESENNHDTLPEQGEEHTTGPKRRREKRGGRLPTEKRGRREQAR